MGPDMDNLKRKEKNLFEELGLQVTQGQVKVGSTYPIFGMITQLTSDDEGKVIAEINHHIQAKMNISDESRLEMLRGKAFETGIFISTVVSVEPTLQVECQAVIFGRNQAYHA